MLEVLVALAILGLLLLGLAEGTSFGLLTFDRQARLMERRADLDAVYRTLRHLVEHARPGSEWEPLVFVGAAHSVAFTSVIPFQTNVSSGRRADVELIVDATHRLMLVWTPHLHAIRTGPPPAPVATPNSSRRFAARPELLASERRGLDVGMGRSHTTSTCSYQGGFF